MDGVSLKTRDAMVRELQSAMGAQYDEEPSLEFLRRVVDTLFDIIPDKQEVKIRGFGTFRWKKRSGRRHFNRHTQEVQDIPEKVVLTFSPSDKHKREPECTP